MHVLVFFWWQRVNGYVTYVRFSERMISVYEQRFICEEDEVRV
jgi:hypothetical protein